MTKNSKMIIAAIVAVIVLTVGVVYTLSSKKSQTAKSTDGTPLSNEPTIAPVDSSVIVDFKKSSHEGEAILSVKDAPSGTDSIEFELSYDALSSASDEGASGSTQQGAIGKCEKSSGLWECGEPSTSGRKIVLGTCSSGVCRYHKITSPINVHLKFTGGYGERVFEKQYTL